jgi:hypothetical protein
VPCFDSVATTAADTLNAVLRIPVIMSDVIFMGLFLWFYLWMVFLAAFSALYDCVFNVLFFWRFG